MHTFPTRTTVHSLQSKIDSPATVKSGSNVSTYAQVSASDEKIGKLASNHKQGEAIKVGSSLNYIFV